MENQLELCVKFTPDGAKAFLKKIIEKIPEFYEECDERYIKSSERKDWIDIDRILSEKRVTITKKLLYNQLYLFQQNEKKYSGEIELEEFSGIIEYFFADEAASLEAAKEKALKSNEIETGVAFGSYGTLIKKEKIRRGRHPKLVFDKDAFIDKYENQEMSSEIPPSLTQATWSLYSFWEENEYDELKQTTGGKKYRILQSLVKFEEDKIIVQYANKFEEFEEFEGKIYGFTHHEQKYFETDLMPLSDNRKVRIMFLFGEEIGELAMSIFYNVRSEGALFSGSGLLVRERKEAKQLIENSKCILHQRIDSQVISHFFERRSQNYLKLPRITEYNLKSLQEKLNLLLWKGVVKDIRIYKHDFFVSIPMAYITEGEVEFNKNKKFCHNTIEILKKNFGFETNYFACEKYDFDTYETMMRGTHYEDSMEGIAESKLFVLVIPNMIFPSHDSELSSVRFSSVWTELGYAIGLKKPILVICNRDLKAKLPNIVESLNTQIMVITPNMYDIKSMKLWFQNSSNIMDIEKFLRDKFIL